MRFHERSGLPNQWEWNNFWFNQKTAGCFVLHKEIHLRGSHPNPPADQEQAELPSVDT